MGSMDLEDGMETVQVEIVGPSGDLLVTCPVTMKEVIPAALRRGWRSTLDDVDLTRHFLGVEIFQKLFVD